MTEAKSAQPQLPPRPETYMDRTTERIKPGEDAPALRYILALEAENESLKAAKPLRMFVWDGRGKYKVCACTTNIAEARTLALEEMSLRGDLLSMREYVKQEQPLIYHRPNAELALTESGETEELNLCLESETAKRQSAESQLAAMKAERDQALEVIREYRQLHFKELGCFGGFNELGSVLYADKRCPTCIKADELRKVKEEEIGE